MEIFIQLPVCVLPICSHRLGALFLIGPFSFVLWLIFSRCRKALTGLSGYVTLIL